MDRPYVARELVPVGLGGVGRPAQRARPAACRRARSTRRRSRPIARLMSVGDDRLPRRPADRPLRPGARGAAVAAASPSPSPQGLGAARRSTAPASARRCASAQDDEIQLGAARRRGRPAAGEHLPGRRRAVHRAQRRRGRPAHRLRRRRGSRRPRQHRRAERRAGWSSTRGRSPTTRRGCGPRSRNRTRCSSSPTPTASGRAGGRACATPTGETERVGQYALVKDENDNRLDVFPDAAPMRRPWSRRRASR